MTETTDKAVLVPFTAAQLLALSDYLDDCYCAKLERAQYEPSQRRRETYENEASACLQLRDYANGQLERLDKNLLTPADALKKPRLELTDKEAKSLLLLLHSQWNKVLTDADELAHGGNWSRADEALDYADEVLALKNKVADYRAAVEKVNGAQ